MSYAGPAGILSTFCPGIYCYISRALRLHTNDLWHLNVKYLVVKISAPAAPAVHFARVVSPLKRLLVINIVVSVECKK